jgi:hypothetical protein
LLLYNEFGMILRFPPLTSILKADSMARIFSIQFDYDGVPQTAMVSVRDTPFFTEYTISMLNEEVLQQLPGNKIISTAPQYFTFLNTPVLEQTPLMEAIINAVSQHLQTTTV